MTKHNLRKQSKHSRLNLSLPEIEKRSRLVCQNAFEQIDWGAVKIMCVYIALKKLKEVDPEQLCEQVRHKFPTIKISLLDQDKNQTPPKAKFDLIIVPTLAFDKNRNRIGWGAGWYDRFLAKQPQAKKVGLCFEIGRLEKIPVEPHDIALDLVVTELYNY